MSDRSTRASVRPEFDRDGPALYAIAYYVQIVTRRRRPFFVRADVRERCKVLLGAAAREVGCTLVACEVNPSSVVFQIEAPPRLSPHNAVIRIRRTVSAGLVAEFEEIERAKVAFGSQYMLTTTPVPETECAAFEAGVPRV